VAEALEHIMLFWEETVVPEVVAVDVLQLAQPD
jgi:hypothetical protein